MSPLLCLSLTVVNLSQIKQNLFYMENIKFITQGYLLEKDNMSDFLVLFHLWILNYPHVLFYVKNSNTS